MGYITAWRMTAFHPLVIQKRFLRVGFSHITLKHTQTILDQILYPITGNCIPRAMEQSIYEMIREKQKQTRNLGIILPNHPCTHISATNHYQHSHYRLSPPSSPPTLPTILNKLPPNVGLLSNSLSLAYLFLYSLSVSESNSP